MGITSVTFQISGLHNSTTDPVIVSELARLRSEASVTLNVGDPDWEPNGDGTWTLLAELHVSSKFLRPGLSVSFDTPYFKSLQLGRFGSRETRFSRVSGKGVVGENEYHIEVVPVRWTGWRPS